MVGRIIGRGGEKIRAMQERSRCKIDNAAMVDQKNQRSCSFIGTNENIAVPRQLIEQIISMPMPMTYEEKMMIPNDMVGAIIGHGGMRIRRIKDESRCKIYIDKNVNQVQRSCSLIGTEKNIAVAKRMIQEIIQIKNEVSRRDLNRKQKENIINLKINNMMITMRVLKSLKTKECNNCKHNGASCIEGQLGKP